MAADLRLRGGDHKGQGRFLTGLPSPSWRSSHEELSAVLKTGLAQGAVQDGLRPGLRAEKVPEPLFPVPSGKNEFYRRVSGVSVENRRMGFSHLEKVVF
jgi:hypothetical protein